MALNVHRLANAAIRYLHPNETITLYRSAGDDNQKGKIIPLYHDPISVVAQIQSIGDDALYHAERTGMNSLTRKIWINDPNLTLQSVDRETKRGGDMILRADGSWWLVDAISEDFSNSGWKSARIVKQVKAPEGIAPP